MPEESLENFLEDQSQDGTHQDRGAFTVNHKRAVELMSEYQLADRRAYVLKLVQWAVAGEANLIDVKTSKSEVSVVHDGQPVPEKVLDSLQSGAIDFSYLARGIYGAAGLSPTEIILTTSRRRYFLLSGKVENATDEPRESLVVQGVKKKLFEGSSLLRRYLRTRFLNISIEGPLQRLIWDATGLTGIESALVRNLCFLCRTPLRLNGKFVNRPNDSNYGYELSGTVLKLKRTSITTGSRLFVNHFGDVAGEIPVRAKPRRGLRLEWFRNGANVGPGELPLSSHLYLNDAPMAMAAVWGDHYKSELKTRYYHFLQHGVLTDVVQESVPHGGISVVSASHLKTSVDGFEIIKDETYETYMTKIRGWLQAAELLI